MKLAAIHQQRVSNILLEDKAFSDHVRLAIVRQLLLVGYDPHTQPLFPDDRFHDPGVRRLVKFLLDSLVITVRISKASKYTEGLLLALITDGNISITVLHGLNYFKVPTSLLEVITSKNMLLGEHISIPRVLVKLVQKYDCENEIGSESRAANGNRPRGDPEHTRTTRYLVSLGELSPMNKRTNKVKSEDILESTKATILLKIFLTLAG